MAQETQKPYEFKAEDSKYQFADEYRSDLDVHNSYIRDFEAYEAMGIGQVYDSVSKSIDGSKITDSYSATLASERAARVMAKLPDGQVTGINADQGKAALLDILRQKWIYPNANAQHKLKIKLRMWDEYSFWYGGMPMFYDWNVTPNYVGPDCWLWSPRKLIPQQGRTSIADMDYVWSIADVGKKYLKDIIESVDGAKDSGGWQLDALTYLSECADKETKKLDTDQDTKVARDRTQQSIKKGITLVTRYESGKNGHWVTFAPDHGDLTVRDLPNPHKNSRIPFVIKYSKVLFDSFYGLGDFQRAKPLQFARDGLTNFYFKGIKMNLIPPIIINANGVLKHTIDYREGAVMMETIPNSVRRLETSTAGLATYQGAQSALTGSLLTLFGSQNAALPAAEALNPSQGKTPAAIGLYADKEATRDGQDRELLESAIEELFDGFLSLIVNIGTESIPVTLFEEDIQSIVDAGMEDVLDIFTNDSLAAWEDRKAKLARFVRNPTRTGGVLKIDPKKLRGSEWRFNIDSGSTAKVSREAQRQALTEFIGVVSKLQNVIQADQTVSVNWGQIMKTFQALTDIPGVEKFITYNGSAARQKPLTTDGSPDVGAGIRKSLAESINYKDAPEDIKRQIEVEAGFTPSVLAQPALVAAPAPAMAPSGAPMMKDPHVAAAASMLHKM